MQKSLIAGLMILSCCLFGMVTSGFAIPLSFTFTGTIDQGVVWDLNTGSSRPRTVANDISGLNFTMTLTNLQYPPYGDRYGFDLEMEVPGYSFDQPGGVFYMLHDVMKVQETGTPGRLSYRFDYDGTGDHIFSVLLEDGVGTGRINWAAIGYSKSQQERLGAYSLHDTDFTWTASSDNSVPVPEPGTMLLFCIGATGIVGYKFRKK